MNSKKKGKRDERRVLSSPYHPLSTRTQMSPNPCVFFKPLQTPYANLLIFGKVVGACGSVDCE